MKKAITLIASLAIFSCSAEEEKKSNTEAEGKESELLGTFLASSIQADKFNDYFEFEDGKVIMGKVCFNCTEDKKTVVVPDLYGTYKYDGKNLTVTTINSCLPDRGEEVLKEYSITVEEVAGVYKFSVQKQSTISAFFGPSSIQMQKLEEEKDEEKENTSDESENLIVTCTNKEGDLLPQAEWIKNIEY